MHEYYPLLIAGAVIGTFSLFFIIAFLCMKDKKESIGFDRNMKDTEIIRRLLGYAPEIDVEEGLRRTSRWYFDHLR